MEPSSENAGMLRQGIPHRREAGDEVVWTGEGAQRVEDDTPTLIIAYGVADSKTAKKVMSASQFSRQLTPALPVAIELCAGDGDGQYEDVQGASGAKRSVPKPLTWRIPVSQVVNGSGHTILLCHPQEKEEEKSKKKGASSSAVRVWGANASGQLGLGHNRPVQSLTQEVPFFRQPHAKCGVKMIAAGASFSMAVLKDARAVVWGCNDHGQLGLGLLGAQMSPRRRGESWNEVSEFRSGGTLARSERVFEGDRVHGWQVGAKPRVLLQNLPEHCEDQPLGIQELLEEELLSFYLEREAEIARLRAEIDAINHRMSASLKQEEALESRFEQTLGGVLERFKAKRRMLDEEYDAKRRALQMQAAKQRVEDDERLLRMRAVLEGVLWGLANGANAQAALVWWTALEECEAKNQARKRTLQAAASLPPKDEKGALEQVVKLVLTCVSARNLPKMDLVGTCDAYVEMELGGQQRKSSVKKNTFSPSWNEEFEMEARGDELLLRVFDWDFIGSNDLVGEAKVTHAELMAATDKEEVRELELKRGHELVLDKSKQVSTLTIKFKVEIQSGVHRLRTSAASRQPKVRVFITRITAAHLPKMDTFGKCDAFCELLLGGERVKTKVKKNTYNPTWEEDITMETKGGDLVLRMSDWDRGSANDLIGNMHITHEELLSGMGREKRLVRGLSAQDGALIHGHDGQATEVTVFWMCEMVNREGSSVKRLAAIPQELIEINKFNFTLKCVSARHLPKMDVVGACDPYVELEIGHQKAQTTVKKNTLDPAWGEEFELEADGGELLLRVMDWDRVGNNDLVGSTRVRHDQLNGPVGKEEELELELAAADGKLVVGKDGSVSVLKISWKVTEAKAFHRTESSGSRGPTDVVETQVGDADAQDGSSDPEQVESVQLFVRCVAAHHLPKVDRFGLCDAFVELKMGGLSMQTQVVKNSLEPRWEEKFELEARGEDLLLRVMDWDRFKQNEIVGIVRVTHASLMEAAKSGEEEELELVGADGAPVFGKDGRASVIVVQVTRKPGSESAPRPASSQLAAGAHGRTLAPPPPKPDDAPAAAAHKTLAPPPDVGSASGGAAAVPAVQSVPLFVKVLSAEHLPKMDTLGSCDPFVEMELGGQKRQTSVKKNTLAPSWDEEFELDAKGFDLVVRVLDWDRGSNNDLVGEGRVGHEEIMRAVQSGDQLFGLQLLRDGKPVKGKDKQVAVVRVQVRPKLKGTVADPTPAVRIQQSRRKSSLASGGVPLRIWLTCISASHLPKMDLMGTCDGFCEIEIGGQREKTHVIKNSYHPEWNEKFEFEARGGDLRLRVLDWDFGSGNDVVGDAIITHTQMMLAAGMGKEETMHLELRSPEGDVVKGHDKETSIISVSLKSEVLDQRRQSTADSKALTPLLLVTVVSADNLPKTDTFGSCDPFVELELGSQKATTEVKKETLSPEWMQSFELSATGPDLLIRVMDWDRFNKNDLVGSVQIGHDLLVGRGGKEQQRELELVGAKGGKVMGKNGRWAVITIRWRFQDSSAVLPGKNRRRSIVAEKADFLGWLKVDLLWFRGEVELQFNDTMEVKIALKSGHRELSSATSEVYGDQRTSASSLNLKLTEDVTDITFHLVKQESWDRRKLLGETQVPVAEVLGAPKAASFDGKSLGPGQAGGFAWTSQHVLHKRPYHEYPATFRFVLSVVHGLNGAEQEKEYRQRCLEKLASLERVEKAAATTKLDTKLRFIGIDFARRRELVQAVYYIKGKKHRAKHADAVAALLHERDQSFQEILRRNTAALRVLERRHGEDARTSEMVQLDLDLDAQTKQLDKKTADRLERCRASSQDTIEEVERELAEATETARGAGAMEAAEIELWFQRYREGLLAAVDAILREADGRIALVTELEEKRMAEVQERLVAAEQAHAAGSREEEEACVQWREQRAIELDEEREAEIVAATKRGSGDVATGGTAEAATRATLREQAEGLQAQLRGHLEEGNDGKGADNGLQLVVSGRVGLVDMEEEKQERRRRERLGQRETLSEEERREEQMRIRRVEDQAAPVQLWAMDVLTSGRGVREIACGTSHAMAVSVGGELWSWGSNAHGELALGDTRARFIPRLVEVPGAFTAVKSVGCGDGYSMAVLWGKAGSTVVMGWGRNDRDQLGLNQRSEIRGWLRRMARPTGWAHPRKPGSRFAVERGDEVAVLLAELGVVSWGALEQVRGEELRGIAVKLALSQEAEHDLCSARAAVPQCYPANVRSPQGDGRVRWEYSAHDHLQGALVPQGLLITRDGKAVFNLGADTPNAECVCGPHAGVATAQMRCAAHGPDVLWTKDMAQLNVFPPEVSNSVVKTKGGPVNSSKLLAREMRDVVRVGVYPQDSGLARGEAPRMQAGLKNVQDGPQHGTEYVRLQVLRLEESFLDPMQTSDNNFFFDGAIHFPYFQPGRKPVERVLCGKEYTVVQLESGELRFLGNMMSAVARLQSKPARRPRRGGVAAEVRRELMKPEHAANGFHLDICDAYHDVAYSLPVKKESLIVRAVRGAQRPRSLLRITFSQLQHLSFPHHTP